MSAYLPQIQVQHGLWNDFSQSAPRSLVLTITNLEALALLAFFAGVLSYSQTRLWVIVRILVCRIVNPTRLDDREDPKSIQNLSQVDAIRALFNPNIRQRDNSMIFTSRWFGASSVVTALLFVVIGAIIPYYLAGAGSISQVRSKYNESCTGVPGYLDPMVDRFAILGDTFFKQCWLNVSDPQPSCGNGMEIITTRPKLNTTKLDSCPFQLGVCLNGTQPVQVEHIGLTAFDFGVNSKSPVV